MALADLSSFVEKNSSMNVVDQYVAQLEEVFLLRNPNHRFDKNYGDALKQFEAATEEGNWFYFPWINTVGRFPAGGDAL